jgi:hypothetical protein
MSQKVETRETRASAAEFKFVVDPALASEIRKWARARLAPDPHGAGREGDQYRTASVYFDTAAFDVFHRRGSFGRSKYRVRRYGQGHVVFLERKFTKPGLVTKRRTRIALEGLERLEAEAPDGQWPGRWFHRRLLARRLQPVCQVSYERTARIVTNGHGTHRLTLDERVCVLPSENLVFSAEEGTPVLDGQLILELKYYVEMPAVFRELVERFALAPRSASKYRLGVAALGIDGNRREEP